MDLQKRLTVRYGRAVVAVLVVGCVLSAPNSATFAVAPVVESPFGGVVNGVPNVNITQPIGVAASLGALFVTQFCQAPDGSRPVWSISGTQSSATVTKFANLLPQGSLG